jgi:hypothetical protein
VFTTKHISGLVFVRYIKDPMFCLYRATSTNSNEVSTKSFNFVSMGVFMALHSNISNLFNISTSYFPWLRKIFSGLWVFGESDVMTVEEVAILL